MKQVKNESNQMGAATIIQLLAAGITLPEGLHCSQAPPGVLAYHGAESDGLLGKQAESGIGDG